MKEKVGGAKIIALIILIGIAAFSILTSKYIMTMKSIDNNIIEGVDFFLTSYEYNNDTIELYEIEK